ncbi:MAG TPA: class I SAM-dependent methyltransferase [Thermoanaerobaculia bacterium]|nr:class I SAM-dependent methyltransferase [Thermoanaerobaculia bacterium]
MPPLWLRRHAGRIPAFAASARDCRVQLEAWNVLPSRSIVDVGCGPGAMALALQDRLASSARYLGIDVHEPSIDWCRRAFAGDPRFRFETASVASPYGRGSLPPAIYAFPLPDGTADLVIAKSLFTHLTPGDAERYLGEIRRVLAEDGAALVTAFLFSSEMPPAFPFGDDRFRWRVKHRIAAAVAFSEVAFRSMIDHADLRVEKSVFGFLPGRAPKPTGQDVLLLRKNPAPSVAPK